MTPSTWLLYVAAVFVLTVTPGPSVFISISTSVKFGVKKALLAPLWSTTAIVGVMIASATVLVFLAAASFLVFNKRGAG